MLFDVFSTDKEYQDMLDKFFSSSLHTIDDAREIRNRYKLLVGVVLYKNLPVRFREFIMDEGNQKELCDLARESSLFSDCSNTLKCIFSEVRRNGVKVPKADDPNNWYNDFYRCAWRETRKIKSVYSSVKEQDSKYTEAECYKLKKALLFLKIFINTSLRSRIPTLLSPDEYISLVKCCSEQTAEKRYRFDANNNNYVRVGGFNNKAKKNRAFYFFGFKGAIALSRKAITRYEKMFNALR